MIILASRPPPWEIFSEKPYSCPEEVVSQGTEVECSPGAWFPPRLNVLSREVCNLAPLSAHKMQCEVLSQYILSTSSGLVTSKMLWA